MYFRVCAYYYHIYIHLILALGIVREPVLWGFMASKHSCTHDIGWADMPGCIEDRGGDCARERTGSLGTSRSGPAHPRTPRQPGGLRVSRTAAGAIYVGSRSDSALRGSEGSPALIECRRIVERFSPAQFQ